jgi:hypothetical protein
LTSAADAFVAIKGKAPCPLAPRVAAAAMMRDASYDGRY